LKPRRRGATNVSGVKYLTGKGSYSQLRKLLGISIRFKWTSPVSKVLIKEWQPPRKYNVYLIIHKKYY